MTTTNPFTSITEANADAVYARTLPEADALPESSLLRPNLDVTAAIIVGMGVCERLPPFYEAFKALPLIRLEQIERFPDYVLSLYVAQSRFTSATMSPEDLSGLLDQGTHWRDILIADARALVARGQLNPALLNDLSGTHGYKNVAFDLSRLSSMFKGAWSLIEGAVGLKSGDLVEVDKLALKLASGVAHRAVSPEQVAVTTEKRQRMFTLFYGSYDQVRRGFGFVRWNEDDADEFAPSLYAGRPNTNIAKKHDGEANAAAANAPAVNSNTQETSNNNKLPVGHPNSDPLGAA